VATRQHAWREARREIDRQIAEVEGQLWAEFVEPGYRSVPARSSPFWSDYAQFAADAGFDPARQPRIRVGDRQVPLFRQQRGGRGDLGSSLEDAGVFQAGAARDAAAGRIRHLMDLRA